MTLSENSLMPNLLRHRLVYVALAALALPEPLAAQQFGIKEITYDEVKMLSPFHHDFETLVPGPVYGLLFLEGVTFAERFVGQTLRSRQDDLLIWHDVLDDPVPEQPLSLMLRTEEPTLNVGYDPHWGSQALLPSGPALSTHDGTGTLAVLFEDNVCSLAFRTAIDGLSRFGNVNDTILRSKPEGSLRIHFFDREGQLIARFMRSNNPEGSIEIGYMQTGQAEAQIAGLLLENLDLRGIAIDDLRFDPVCPFKLF